MQVAAAPGQVQEGASAAVEIPAPQAQQPSAAAASNSAAEASAEQQQAAAPLVSESHFDAVGGSMDVIVEESAWPSPDAVSSPEGDDAASQDDPAAWQGPLEQAQQSQGETKEADAFVTPPSALLVKKRGEICTVVTFDHGAADRELLGLFAFRDSLLKQHRHAVHPDNGDIPYGTATMALTQFKKLWAQRDDQKAKSAELWRRRGMDIDSHSRTVQSNFRTYAFQTFGGKAWVVWYLMLGEIPAMLIGLANSFIRQKVLESEGRDPRTGPHTEPKLSVRNAAKARGEEILPDKQGVRCDRNPGYMARQKAKLLQKQIDKADTEHMTSPTGSWNMSAYDYYKMKNEIKAPFQCQSVG